MKCPLCGGADLAHEKRDMPYVYRGEKTMIPAVEGDYCDACDEVILAKHEVDRVSFAMRDFQRQMNSERVLPEYIAAVRKKLGLDQRQAAAIFGGGANAFSRYETGKVLPPVALVKLLKVLDQHPQLLALVQSNEPPVMYRAVA